jgi:uncharacterized protein (TIGR02453 family)
MRYFTPATLTFLRSLKRHNTREWFADNRDRYLRDVEAPMLQFIGDFAPRLRQISRAYVADPRRSGGSMFRIYRDTRFSADKSPYKTHQGGYVATGDGAGWYVQVSAEGLFVAGGIYQTAPDQLARLRAAVDDDHSGPELEKTLRSLRRKGFEVGGEQVRTRPRGVAADHPRLDLMRRKAITVGREHGEPDWLATAETERRVRADWRAMRPLIDWIAAHLGAAGQRRDE